MAVCLHGLGRTSPLPVNIAFEDAQEQQGKPRRRATMPATTQHTLKVSERAEDCTQRSDTQHAEPCPEGSAWQLREVKARK